jgi:gamma-glutamyl phosphate reductase
MAAETGFQARMAQYLALHEETSKKISEKVKNSVTLRHPLSDFTLAASNRPTDY